MFKEINQRVSERFHTCCSLLRRSVDQQTETRKRKEEGVGMMRRRNRRRRKGRKREKKGGGEGKSEERKGRKLDLTLAGRLQKYGQCELVRKKCKWWDFPSGAVDKNLPTNSGHTALIPGLGRFHILQSNYARVPQLQSLHTLGPESHNLGACELQLRKPK